MGLSNKTLNRYFDTVWAISASRYVDKFRIGITARAGGARHSQYRPNGYAHLVILADRLSRQEALDLEEDLIAKIIASPRHLTHRKFENVLTPHIRSFGGAVHLDPRAEIHSVYMVWWEP
jgi:hypothetical protein